MPPNPYRRQPNINDMMYPKGSKQPRQVWAAVMNVYKAPETTPQPTPSPTGTANPTPTPTITPTGTAAITPTPSVTQTQTNTPTPSGTPSATTTPTGTPSITPTPTATQPAFILNTYSGATAAYSLRKLRSAYSGNAIRVVRTGDAATLNIGFTSSGELDTTALLNFITGSTSGLVDVWYDQSGNGRDLTQSSRPVIVSGGTLLTQNSKPSVYFNNNYMEFGTQFNVATPNTTIALVAKRGTGNTGVMFGNLNYQNNFGTTNIQIQTGGITVGSFGTGFDTFSQATVLRVSANSKAYLNGTQSSTTNTTSLSNVGNSIIVLGNRYQNDLPYVGFFSEGIWWATDQTSNRTGIESNQKAYYGTP